MHVCQSILHFQAWEKSNFIGAYWSEDVPIKVIFEGGICDSLNDFPNPVNSHSIREAAAGLLG